jgi:hypothetical protein
VAKKRQAVEQGAGFGYEGESAMLTGSRCASMPGFSLHATTHIRDQLERLIRYPARGCGLFGAS